MIGTLSHVHVIDVDSGECVTSTDLGWVVNRDKIGNDEALSAAFLPDRAGLVLGSGRGVVYHVRWDAGEQRGCDLTRLEE